MDIDYFAIKSSLAGEGFQKGLRVERDGSITELDAPNGMLSPPRFDGVLWKFDGGWIGQYLPAQSWGWEVMYSIRDGALKDQLGRAFERGDYVDIGITKVAISDFGAERVLEGEIETEFVLMTLIRTAT